MPVPRVDLPIDGADLVVEFGEGLRPQPVEFQIATVALTDKLTQPQQGYPMTGRRVAAIKLASICGAVMTLATVSAAPQMTADTQRTIAQVARERMQVATKGYDLALQGFRSGTAPVGATSEWLHRRAQAALDLPDTAERLTVLQECLKKLKENATQMERSEQAGVVSMQDALLARDRELECELWLAKAQDGR